jgi:hypothetical protein
LKTGLLKKKGMLFYNNRIVTLSTKGMLSYYDPKVPKVPKMEFNLRNLESKVKISRKTKDSIEIVHKGI